MGLRGEGSVTRYDLGWPPSQERGSPVFMPSQCPLFSSREGHYSSALVRNSSLTHSMSVAEGGEVMSQVPLTQLFSQS